MTSSYFGRESALGQGKWALWLVGALILLGLGRHALDIFAGVIPGNDDMMRLQQIRDLLNGQDWFDVDQSRFLNPEGGNMHWSRLPDLFVAAVILLTSPLIGEAQAEALGMSLWPPFLLGVTMAALVVIMRRLGIQLAGQVAALALLGFGLSAAIYNFWPGRIDHHNLVVTLTMIGTAAALSMTMSVRSGILVAGCLVAMLSVAIESLPYAGALVLAMGLFWIVRGHTEAPRLAAFGAALIGFACLFYIADAPGFSSRRMVCDAYGTSHFAGLVGGGALLAFIGVFGGGLDTWQKRAGAGIAAGLVTLALVYTVQPDCLGDPYAEVSDQARVAWLEAVGEAKSIGRVWAEEPADAVWKFGFILAALIATGLMIRSAPAGQQAPRAVFGLLMLLSAAATVWQIRGTTFSHVFGVVAAGWALGLLAETWWQKRGPGPMLALFAGVICLTPMSWNVLGQQLAPPVALDPETGEPKKAYNTICRDKEAYAELADMEPLNLFTSIDVSTTVLVRTPHSVFAGPYHRNVQAIENATDVFLGPTEAARDKILAMGATHMLYCRGLNETARYARLAPDGFAAEMEADRVPGWLTAVDGKSETDGVVRLYAIVSDAEAE
ncbi:MAG: hypothetical protein QNI84_13780 [Henriciella sp.]|nr:hypothetical protein [Henriciella sp.]